MSLLELSYTSGGWQEVSGQDVDVEAVTHKLIVSFILSLIAIYLHEVGIHSGKAIPIKRRLLIHLIYEPVEIGAMSLYLVDPLVEGGI